MGQLFFTFMHCHKELRKFCLTNVLQFWQTCSCWNDLDSCIMDKATLLNVDTNPGEKRRGEQKLCPQWWEPIPCHQAEKAFCFFELPTGGSNHSMALTELFMSFNRIGQLYYGLANLLKVYASNLMLYTSNLGTKKLYIVYKVNLGWGLVCKP